jgi:hypothetical protein
MIYVVTMPGALSCLGDSGSFIRPDIKAAALDLGLRIRIIEDRTPTTSHARKFVRTHDRSNHTLLLCGKSYGAVKVTEWVLKKVYQEFGGYRKLALFTVDAYGAGFGKDRRKLWIKLPKSLRESENFKAINLYQRNGGMEGALVLGARNIEVSRFPDGKKVTHMNIVDHPDVEGYARSLLIWLAT